MRRCMLREGNLCTRLRQSCFYTGPSNLDDFTALHIFVFGRGSHVKLVAVLHIQGTKHQQSVLTTALHWTLRTSMKCTEFGSSPLFRQYLLRGTLVQTSARERERERERLMFPGLGTGQTAFGMAHLRTLSS